MAGRGVIAAALTLALAAPALAQTTTEDRTIVGDPGAPYSRLQAGPGWERVVREELAPAQAGREQRRTSLLYFAQISDMHIIDEESPARVELLDIDGSPFTSAWRPQEAFGPHMSDYAIRGINAHTTSPVTGAPLEFAITTGDSADSMQRNETEWVVKLLEGGRLDPNSGVASPCAPKGEAGRYTGVQDYDDYLESTYFYDPDRPAGRHAAWPFWPGLMDRAQQPFEAAGLAVPSYVAFGNHDGLVQGNNAAIAAYEAIATGCHKPMAPLPADDLSEALLTSSPDRLVSVPPDPKRSYVDKPQYRELHTTGKQADAHGFAYVDPAESAASNDHASYYAWSPKPGFRFISLDTVAEGGVLAADGNLDDPQFRWLRRQLQAAQAAGELVVAFGHHPIGSLSVNQPDELAPPCTLPDSHGHDINPGCDRDPRDSTPIRLGNDVRDLFLAHRNVIAYVAGHTHRHRITPFERPAGGGFWGIETASEIDWPLQSRLIDVVDNGDGTLSIIGTVLDHASPVGTPAPGTPAAGFTHADLAAIGRELAFNDFQTGLGSGGSGEGEPQDRNVELLLPDPRAQSAAPASRPAAEAAQKAVTIAGRPSLRGGRRPLLRTAIRIACPAGAARSCSGSASVIAPVRGRRAARTTTIAKRGFAVPPGTTQELFVRLSERGARLLRRDGRLRATIRVATRRGGLRVVTTRTVTLRSRG